jgi:ferric-dicitrate binding protein FerR (iron transport regulator)
MNGDTLDILICRYLDGQATPDEMDRLGRLIETDPLVGQELVRMAYCDALLVDALTPATQESEIAPEPMRIPAAAEKSERRRTALPRWTGWAAAACVLVGLGIGWRLMTGGPNIGPTPAVAETIPNPLPLTGNGKIAVNQELRSGSIASEFVLAGEKTKLTLAPNSTFAYTGDSAGKHFKLTTGRIECQVDKQPAGKPLVIETPQGTVTVVGTQFNVTTSTGWTRVKVDEGTVRVMRQSDGASVDVSAGQFVEMPAAGAKAPQWAGAATGKDMSEYWSVKIRPAGIDQ